MTDTFGQEQSPVLDPKIRKALKLARKDKKRVGALEALVAQKDREIAFARAGIPDDARGQALAKVYDGDLDPTKIQSTFAELFGADANSASDGTETQRRIADAGVGGGTPTAPGTVEFADALRAAKGDNKKVLELIRNAPPGAGIKLPDID